MGAERHRIKTHILGLDEEMHGGIPHGNVVLLSGAPGTMKSSVALNLLYNNAVHDGKSGLYVSLEQGRDSLLDQAASINMDFTKVEDKVRIIDMGYLRKNLEQAQKGVSWMDVFRMYAENLKSTLKYDILVADSLTVFDVFLGADVNRREKLFQLFEWMRDLKCTSVIIAEAGHGPTGTTEEDYLADGIIRLSKERVGAMDMQRMLLVDKMRGTKHNTSLFTLLFEQHKFQVTRAI